MYQAEVSTPESRGFMVSMHGIMFAMGYTLSAWIGFGCYFVSASGSDSSFAWRFPLAFQMVPAILLLGCSPWLPFSPRWLVRRFPSPYFVHHAVNTVVAGAKPRRRSPRRAPTPAPHGR